ncbi:unnamed protein product [Meganyctiphanes norvegica]|uniref:Spaetzle domain-containing protein n=1 Tax=Meganyctiphanes norvegica TaxID=48144 RepID=A0AAV2RI04_MEGNR
MAAAAHNCRLLVLLMVFGARYCSGSRPSYHHDPVPSYHRSPAYQSHEQDIPACAANTTTAATWCLTDTDYPNYEIKAAGNQHYEKLLPLYADVADLDTKLSVERPNTLAEETYLCPSVTSYIKPLRAINTAGKWRVIVNEVEVHYETLTQSVRIEECKTAGETCPLVPECYETKCLQKSIYHRFLIYDPYVLHFPFTVETFKLPATCSCLLGAYVIDH